MAICMLLYCLFVDACDEYCKLDEFTTSEFMKMFSIAIYACIESTYVMQPTREDFSTR